MDVAKEITKLESKKEKLNGQLGKLREAMEIADYVTKVQHFQRKRYLSRGNVQLNSSLRSLYSFLTLFAPYKRCFRRMKVGVLLLILTLVFPNLSGAGECSTTKYRKGITHLIFPVVISLI